MLSKKMLLTKLGIAALLMFVGLGHYESRAMAQEGEYDDWVLTQRELLVQGAWDAAITDADGSKGAVTLVFYPNGAFRLSMWVRDPETGSYLSSPAAEFTGRYDIYPDDVYTGEIVFTIEGSGGIDENYLQFYGVQKMALTKLPRDQNAPILFINRNR